ncbi:MAG: SURF1 family cytochrome oxidase biogenesis protein [Pseudomonadota bacterium]
MSAPLSQRQFVFRPVLTLCAVIAMGVLIALGNWQLQRLEWKEDLVARIDARVSAEPIPFAEAAARAAAGEDVEYVPVRINGVRVPESEASVFGVVGGVAGAFPFVPVRSGDDVVYVNTGFEEADPGTSVESTAGERRFTGLFRTPEQPAPPAAWFVSREQSADGLWFVRDPRLFSAAADINASPYYIDAFDAAGAPQTRLEFNNRHLEYALTWFGLAGALAAVWLAMSLRKRAD